jgi:hypothetical protein
VRGGGPVAPAQEGDDLFEFGEGKDDGAMDLVEETEQGDSDSSGEREKGEKEERVVEEMVEEDDSEEE